LRFILVRKGVSLSEGDIAFAKRSVFASYFSMFFKPCQGSEP